MSIAAAGIEPEMALPFARELHEIATVIGQHRFSKARRSNAQRGVASMLMLSAIGFAAATYINEIAWVDAALSIAAQAAVAYISRHRKN
ncbi:hypothetical protein [Paraburkholderia dilworthii]|uniref:Uncharacterized protein n=1 Tax=Paraburkholderia dilworthii TaxID=948106 RepID=A0ABW9DBF3_9BURK